jgi:acyl-CoA dehydrogenase
MSALDTRIAFSDEQAMLLDAAATFCREQSPTSAVRARLLTETGFDAAVWRSMVELGWLGIAVPERFGGSGLTLTDTVVVAETMGRHLLATPFTGTQIAIQALLGGGSAPQQDAWLPRLAQGGIATVGLFEDDGHWDLARIGCRAEPAGARLRLHGDKVLVTDAAVAELLIVSVLRDGSPALVLLDKSRVDAAALSRETIIDETRRSWRLRMDGIEIDDADMITGAAALAALRTIRDAALLLAAAEAAGGTAGALALTVDYLNTRSAFGRKIGSYQALKHTCADILVGLERARSHLYHAATRIADGADAEIALRMAKAEAGDTFAFAGDRAVQFHGGFGFTWDCDAQLYLRRALWLQPWFGDGNYQRKMLADRLLAADDDATA